MKLIYFAILFFSGVWMSQAQTNVNTNGVDAILALVTTNRPAPPPSVSLMPARGPITIATAGPAVFDWNSHWMTYSDNVRVTNGQMTLTCEWLKSDIPQNGEEVTNIIAETNVVIDSMAKNGQTARGTGDQAVYDFHVRDGVTNKTITLFGNPAVVRQGLTYMSGTNIVYDLMSGLATAYGPTQGGYWPTNAPSGTNSATTKTNSPAKPKLF